MSNKLSKNKLGNHFRYALIVIFLSIAISMLAFITQDKGLVGFATINYNSNAVTTQSNLIEFKDVKSLGSLAAGKYYIDEHGVVFWMEDDSKPAIAKVDFIDESQKNRYIYVDKEGNVGYLIG